MAVWSLGSLEVWGIFPIPEVCQDGAFRESADPLLCLDPLEREREREREMGVYYIRIYIYTQRYVHTDMYIIPHTYI